MLQGSLASSAPLVLGALSEQHTPNHGALWEMLLTYCRALPDAWAHVDFAKMVLPRLTAFLRCQILTLQVCCRFGLEKGSISDTCPALPVLPSPDASAHLSLSPLHTNPCITY